MSRIRSIKPEFWSSEQIVECSTNARLLFIGLWNFCDDHGRHTFSPKQIKALVFPADNFTPEQVRGMLDELSTNDLITVYEFEGKQFFQVNGWHHQKIDKRQDPKFPGPFDEGSTIIPRTVSTDRNTEGNTEKKDLSSVTNGHSPPGKPKPKREKPDDSATLDGMTAIYNREAASLGLPRTRASTETREKLLRARARDLIDIFGFNDPLVGMGEVMAKIRASPFLCDRKNSWFGFDWLLNETNFLKIMEGTYEKERQSAGFALHA